jgi:hypothetical protein
VVAEPRLQLADLRAGLRNRPQSEGAGPLPAAARTPPRTVAARAARDGPKHPIPQAFAGQWATLALALDRGSGEAARRRRSPVMGLRVAEAASRLPTDRSSPLRVAEQRRWCQQRLEGSRRRPQKVRTPRHLAHRIGTKKGQAAVEEAAGTRQKSAVGLPRPSKEVAARSNLAGKGAAALHGPLRADNHSLLPAAGLQRRAQSQGRQPPWTGVAACTDTVLAAAAGDCRHWGPAGRQQQGAEAAAGP